MAQKTRKLLLTSYLSPGDTVMLTAAVRDLHIAHPFEFITDIDTSGPVIWENNPYITKLKWDKIETEVDGHTSKKLRALEPDLEIIHCHYPLIDNCNNRPYHFIHGYTQFLEEKLGVKIPITKFAGDIHLSVQEKSWMSQVEEAPYNLRRNFWIIVSGGKNDYTAKWWDPLKYQQVIDYFQGRLKFVQVGEQGHWHPDLTGVIDLRGKTNLRQLIRLVYHSEGILCPVTLLMHLAAAVPVKPGKPKDRACVVVAGGREGPNWEAYPQHQFIHTCGALPCCEQGGCWASRCQLIGDGDRKDEDNVCPRPIPIAPNLRIPECMHMITAEDVIRRIELHYTCTHSNRKYFE